MKRLSLLCFAALLFTTAIGGANDLQNSTVCDFEDEDCDRLDYNENRVVYGITDKNWSERIAKPSPTNDHFFYVKCQEGSPVGTLQLVFAVTKTFHDNPCLSFDYFLDTETNNVTRIHVQDLLHNKELGFVQESTGRQWVRFTSLEVGSTSPTTEIAITIAVEGKDIVGIDNMILFGERYLATTPEELSTTIPEELPITTTVSTMNPTTEGVLTTQATTASPDCPKDQGFNIKLENCNCHCTGGQLH